MTRCANLIVLVLAAVTTILYAHEISEEDASFLANLKFDDLPRIYQYMINKETRMGNSSHWCCKHDLNSRENITLVYQKVVVYFTEKETYTKETHSCGFLYANKCETTGERYKISAKYENHPLRVTTHNKCDSEALVCCNGYLLVADNCLHKDGIDHEFVDILKELQGANLLGK